MRTNRFDLALLLASFQGTAAAGPPSSNALDVSYTFVDFVSDFEKPYEPGTEEWKYREDIFNDNLSQILSHNALFYASNENDSSSKGTTYTKGVNKFTDKLASEIYKGFDKRQHPAYGFSPISSTTRKLSDSILPFKVDEVSDLPRSVDWRTKGVVTPVKNQKNCGSCWAFASTEVIESHVAIETGTLLELSPQQLVDCAPNFQHCGGGGGCSGATVEVAFGYVIKDGGMVAEDTLEYTAADGNCTVDDENNASLRRKKKDNKVATITDYVTLPTNDYKITMNAIAKMGPVAVAVDASGWYMYESGVFVESEYHGWDTDHAVVLVGYGTDEESGLDYWLVRNSWGPNWGEDGYIRMKRFGEEKHCILDVTPLDGSGCEFDLNGAKVTPKPVEICDTDGILFDVVVPIGGHLVH